MCSNTSKRYSTSFISCQDNVYEILLSMMDVIYNVYKDNIYVTLIEGVQVREYAL